MKEELEKLQAIINEIELLTVITKRFGTENVNKMLIQKKIEDGIIENFHNAESYQLDMMKNNYRFQYYEEDVVNKLVDKAIIKNTRLKKLEQLSR
jgi:hypothetical protein